MIEFDKIESFLSNLKPSIKVISFDIFNTILIRLTSSDRVFKLASEYLAQGLLKKFSMPISPEWIYNNKKDFKRKYDRRYFIQESEWTLTMWLQAMSQKISVEPRELVALGKESELSAEFDCVELSDHALQSVQLAKDRGFFVIATSDMWLEDEDMKILLNRFGLRFHQVFTSGSMGVSKRRGTIFKKIQDKMGMSVHSFAHIGDNPKADWLRPKLAGWSSLMMPHSTIINKNSYLPVVHGVVEKKKQRFSEIIQMLELPPASKDFSPYYQIAYNELAPLLILFSLWQWRRFRKQNIDVVFFIARDARLMFDVYEQIAGLLPESPPRFYVRLSRKILAMVHPDELLINVKHLPGKVGKKKVAHWLNNFLLGGKLRNKILADSGLDETSVFSDNTRDALKTSLNQHRSEIESCIQKHKKVIQEYLMHMSGNCSMERVGIVDSGWACTIQECLKHILKEANLISGAYFGVSAQGSPPTAKNQKYGLLRDDFRNLPHMNPIESSAGVVRLWDTLLRESTGTAIRLERDTNGSIEPVLSDRSAIGELEIEAAAFIKKGIFEGVRKRFKAVKLLIRLLDNFSDTDVERAAAYISRQITTYPDQKIAAALLRLGFDEGADGGRKASFGIKGIRDGVAWYPGILSCYRLSYLSRMLEIAARAILIYKIGHPKKKKNSGQI